MVCIIDDREDVWNMATNLIQGKCLNSNIHGRVFLCQQCYICVLVKPYHFFQHTGDINAPPGMSKHELDGQGVDFSGECNILLNFVVPFKAFID